MIHVIHMTDDAARLTEFYKATFGAVTFPLMGEPHYAETEDRWAALLLVRDLAIEAMAPNRPVDPTKPVGRFYTKYGRHLHSVGFRVDDLVGLGNELIKKGVYIGKPGGGRLDEVEPGTLYFYPSPRDTCGLMVELCGVDIPTDPRDADDWSSRLTWWERDHPLGVKTSGFTTFGVTDLEAAVERYVELFAADLIHGGADDLERVRYQILRIGDALIRIAQPLDGDSPLGAHVAKWANMIYSITLGVDDLETAEAWLGKQGVRSDRLGDELLAAHPDDTFGAPYFFTTTAIPNDPFA
jgi:catechol 2,3-dioxygenase-like lactoylglutathione lyase family enzyme